jgi:DNA repair ATPase RecN
MSSCGGKITKKAVKKGEVFKASIEDFEKNRMKFSKQVTESINDANEALQEEDPNTEKISKDFEKEWNDIQRRYNKMKKDFDDIGKTSNEYFEHLNELANGINREELRKTELGKNQELLVKWEQKYSVATVDIAKVDKVLLEGNDFHRVLLLSSVRDKIQENVNDLERISTQAKDLLDDLKSFTDAGRELVQNEG